MNDQRFGSTGIAIELLGHATLSCGKMWNGDSTMAGLCMDKE